MERGHAGAAILALAMVPASADTLKGALTQAYQNNPTLNAQRASVRATDETVPQALSGYRPRVSLTANAGEQYLDAHTRRSPPLAPPATPTVDQRKPRPCSSMAARSHRRC
jgi:outer membrane protein